jgi:hypothetical protein
MAPCRINAPARMAESADAAASKAVVRKDVRVQVPLRARTHCDIAAGQALSGQCETTRSAVRDHNVVTTGSEVAAACHEGRPPIPSDAARTPRSPRGSLFAAETGGNDVGLQITDRVPGRIGVSFNQADDVAIFIGGSEANVPLSRFTDDLYERVKLGRLLAFTRNWRRIETDSTSPRRSPYGPDNEVLKRGRSTTKANPTMMQAHSF